MSLPQKSQSLSIKTVDISCNKEKDVFRSGQICNILRENIKICFSLFHEISVDFIDKLCDFCGKNIIPSVGNFQVFLAKNCLR